MRETTRDVAMWTRTTPAAPRETAVARTDRDTGGTAREDLTRLGRRSPTTEQQAAGRHLLPS
jgi:hypothetical protein